jgi:hypothetical protein
MRPNPFEGKLLRLLGERRTALTLEEAAAGVGCTLSTAEHELDTLVRSGRWRMLSGPECLEYAWGWKRKAYARRDT